MKSMSWLVMCVLVLTSCASSGAKTLHVNTEPKGAVVSMGEQTCQTPCDIIVPEDEEYVLNIYKDGFENKVVRQFSEWEKSPWVLGTAAVATVGILVASSTMIVPALVGMGVASQLEQTKDIDIDVTMQAKE